jgi:RNA polymerase sigma factor (sigma-70 family)
MVHGPTGTVLEHLRMLMHAEVTAELSDAQLLQRFTTEHDEAAFAALMARHGPAVLRVCRRILNDTHDAEDAFQAAFLVLARLAGSIRKPEAVGSWLYGVAHRIAVKSSRAAARRRQRERQIAEMPARDLSSEMALRDLQTVLDEEVNRLPDRYRAPFVRYCLEGKSRAEVAHELGWKEGTLASRLDRARHLLRQRLTRRGVTLSAALAAVALAEEGAAAVPSPLAAQTLQAALQFAAGTTTVAASRQVMDLAKGALPAVFLGRIKRLVALLAALALLPAAGLAALHGHSTPDQKEPPARGGAPGPPAARQDEGRADSYGDPLPDRAVRRFGTLRLRNCGPVVFSPDGKHIVTAGGKTQSDVVFWDRRTGKEMRRLSAGGAILRLQFSPDGRLLAAMSGTVYSNPVWDVASGKVQFRFKGWHGTFTADGRKLLGIYHGKNAPTISCWTVATGAPAGEWILPTDARGTRCSPDGKTVAYVLGDSLVLYDLPARAERRRWPGEKMRELTFSPDGSRLAASSLRGLRVWEVASGRQEYSWGQLVDSAACFSADGKRLAWTGYDRRSIPYPWVADIGRGEPRRLGLPINNLPSQLAFSPDGGTLVVNSDARALELRAVTTGKDTLPLDANTGRIFGLQLSADGRFLATTDAFRVLVWEKATGKLLRRFPEEGVGGRADQPPMVWDVRLGADGQLLRGNPNNRYGHWEEAGPAALTRLQKLGLKDRTGPAFATFRGTVQDVLESPGGRYLAVRTSVTPPGVIDRSPGVLRVWDTQTGLALEHVRLPDGHQLGAFSSDRRVLVTTTREGTIQLWDLATGEQRVRLRGHPGCAVRALLFTPDCRFLFSGGDDSQVLLWDLTGRALDGVWRTGRHDPRKRPTLWEAVGGKDAAAAHRAVWELAADPEGTVGFLQAQVKPAPRLSDRRLKEMTELIGQLDAGSFATRQQAQALLRKIGEPAVPAVLRALASKPRSLEQTRRLEQLLHELVPPAPTGATLRCFRAVEVLERIGTVAARRALAELAGGQDGVRLTQAAREALERLGVR